MPSVPVLVLGPSANSTFDEAALDLATAALRRVESLLAPGVGSEWDPPTDGSEGGRLLVDGGMEASIHGMGGGLSASMVLVAAEDDADLGSIVDVVDFRTTFAPDATDQAALLRNAVRGWIADLETSRRTTDAAIERVRANTRETLAAAVACLASADAEFEGSTLVATHPTATTAARIVLVGRKRPSATLDADTHRVVVATLPCVVDAEVSSGSPPRIRFSPWTTSIQPIDDPGRMETMRTMRRLELTKPPSLVQSGEEPRT